MMSRPETSILSEQKIFVFHAFIIANAHIRCFRELFLRRIECDLDDKKGRVMEFNIILPMEMQMYTLAFNSQAIFARNAQFVMWS